MKLVSDSLALTKDWELLVSSMDSPALTKEPLLDETPETLARDDSTFGDSAEDTEGYPQRFTKGNSHYEVLRGIRLPPITFPLSQYVGWEPPLPLIEETNALNILLGDSSIKKETYGGDEYVSVDLDQFSVYRDSNYFGGDELTSLHEVALRQGNTKFFFDGILNLKGGRQMFLRRVPFEYVSIGGYGEVEQHTVGSDIWIQSVHGKRKGDIWYHLCRPSPEYRPYYEIFLWLTDLGKHLLDFLAEHDTVTLNDFKSDFADWLQQVHGSDASFQNWFCQFGKHDFRSAVIAYGEYLFKQALDINRKYEDSILWQEIGITQPIIQEQPQQAKGTVVTPYVYRCFQNMEWGEQLQVSQPTPTVLLKQQKRMQELGFESSKPDFKFKPCGGGLYSAPVPHKAFEVRQGDVISVEMDEETIWKTSSKDDLWYAFVQGIRQHQNGTIWLDVIWLYRPSDTVCANMTYPHPNELFMSDHCNCGDHKIRNTEVVGKVDVSFFSSVAREGAPFCVRQTYHTDDQVFLTLKEEDFYCSHRRKSAGLGDSCRETYHPGDTVLVDTGSKLGPVEIISCSGKNLRVRELPQRKGDDRNELVYTDRTRSIYIGYVQRRCYVRFYSEYERKNGLIPPPYCRQGNGDAFFIIYREVTSPEGIRSLQPLESSSLPTSLTQGFDPKAPVIQLRALSIFSGGGSFDRGLEEGGAVRNEWAVEWSKEAMLTYRANLRHPGAKLFWGSVDDFLDQSLKGKESNIVARVGEVDFISAGSPCQGYALTNNFKQNQAALRNCSMIASVAAFIDHFRPKYAVLENVTAMAKRSEKNPLSQMLCALIGMGYQARILNLDAWSFGAPQSRSRLFIFVAAPGLKLPGHPALTHSHPPRTTNRSLGEAANGLPFGRRRFEKPIFDFVTAAEGTRDLPRLAISRCITISDPDMRTAQKPTSYKQTLIELVPKAPWTQGLETSVLRGWMAKPQSEAFLKRRRAWNQKEASSYGRVHPKGLFPTIITRVIPACAFTGRIVHWEQDRLLTVKEARRAQGIPDDEVLIGSPTQQWKIIGNSVARQVALSLGMTLREACLENERMTAAASNVVTSDNPTKSIINKYEDNITDRGDTSAPISASQDAFPSEKQSRRRRILRSETSTQETIHMVTTTITERFLGSRDATPSILSDSSRTVIDSEHESQRMLESTGKRLREVRVRTSRSQKRRRTSRFVVLDSDDEQ